MKNFYERKTADGIEEIPILTDDNLTGRKLVFRTLAVCKKDLIRYAVYSLLAALLSMSVPVVLSLISKKMTAFSMTQNVILIILTLLLAVIASWLVTLVVNRMRIKIQSQTGYLTFTNIFIRIMHLYSPDEREIAGMLTGRLMHFIGSAENVTGSLFSIVIYGMECLMIFLFLIFGDFSSFSRFSILFIAACCIAYSVWAQIAGKNLRKEEQQQHSDFVNLSKELIDNIETVKNTMSEKRMICRIREAFDAYFSLQIQLEKIKRNQSILFTVLGNAGLLIIFILVSLTQRGSIGDITVIVSLFSLLMGYITPLASAISSYISELPRLEFADKVMERPAEIWKDHGENFEISGKITLSHVTFSYPESEVPALKDISLKIGAGEHIGIAGSSGCGKSTLIRVILSFEKADSGEVFFDGRNAADCNMRAVRQQFGTVLQDARLMTGTIAANIGLCEEPNMEKVRQAAKLAAIDEDIAAMPMGYYTLVSSESERISGGQRQRIVIARALMDEPKVVIFDEATSAMDNITQRTIHENLQALGMTRITIAHRISTIENCDRIYCMDAGRIVESGTHAELIARDGLYARLIRQSE